MSVVCHALDFHVEADTRAEVFDYAEELFQADRDRTARQKAAGRRNQDLTPERSWETCVALSVQTRVERERKATYWNDTTIRY